MLENKRIDYIDIFKALAIVLIIMGHINFANYNIKSYLFAYNMPLFFYIYGIIFNLKKIDNYNFKKSIKSKFKTILIPYILWALIFCEFSSKNLIYIIYGSHQSLIHINCNSSLWFLPCYFISTIVFENIIYFIYKITKNNKFKYIMIAIMIILCMTLSLIFPIINDKLGCPWGINVALMAVVLMLFGYITSVLFKYLKEINISKIIIFTIIMFIMTFGYIFNNSIKHILISENIYGNVFIFIIIALCGCLFILGLSMIIDEFVNNKFKKFLIFFGQNTLITFAIHKIFITLIHNILKVLPFSIPNIITLPLSTILIVVFCIICIVIINKYVPQFNGKYKLKES